MTVGRTQIDDATGDHLGERPTSREDLIVHAIGVGARPERINVLRRLPQRSFSDVRRLWQSLPDVPIEA